MKIISLVPIVVLIPEQNTNNTPIQISAKYPQIWKKFENPCKKMLVLLPLWQIKLAIYPNINPMKKPVYVYLIDSAVKQTGLPVNILICLIAQEAKGNMFCTYGSKVPVELYAH